MSPRVVPLCTGDRRGVPGRVHFRLHRTSPTLHHYCNSTTILDQFLCEYPALESVYSAMKTYISPKLLLLLVFGLLLVARGVVSDEKAPPTTLQIGTPQSPVPSSQSSFLPRCIIFHGQLYTTSSLNCMWSLTGRNQASRARGTMYT